jgi:hypothetical protein
MSATSMAGRFIDVAGDDRGVDFRRCWTASVLRPGWRPGAGAVVKHADTGPWSPGLHDRTEVQLRPRRAINRQKRAFTNFPPGVSADALKRMRKEVRGWRIHRQTPGTLDELAQQYNPKIRGWWDYFGAFYRSAMHKLFQYLDQKLMQWARRKYKTLSHNQSAVRAGSAG